MQKQENTMLIKKKQNVEGDDDDQDDKNYLGYKMKEEEKTRDMVETD
jgi:hypothetical protein